jgi:hypothetical protein
VIQYESIGAFTHHPHFSLGGMLLRLVSLQLPSWTGDYTQPADAAFFKGGPDEASAVDIADATDAANDGCAR